MNILKKLGKEKFFFILAIWLFATIFIDYQILRTFIPYFTLGTFLLALLFAIIFSIISLFKRK